MYLSTYKTYKSGDKFLINFIKRIINSRYFQSFKCVINDPKGYIDRNKFVKYMNKTSKQIGMKSSRFQNPSGTSSYSFTTALDLSVLCEKAISYNLINKIWQKKSISVNIKGTNSRTINIKNIVFNNCDNNLKNFLIGGKSGSLNAKNKSHIFYLEINKEKHILAILAQDKISFQKIYTIAYEICTNSFSGVIGDFTNKMLENSGGFIFKNINNGTCFFKNENIRMIPASVTKILTAICVLESGINLNSNVVISKSDISKGSGSKFLTGDIVTMTEALYIMIMESSNTMANAISRTVGSNFNF